MQNQNDLDQNNLIQKSQSGHTNSGSKTRKRIMIMGLILFFLGDLLCFAWVMRPESPKIPSPAIAPFSEAQAAAYQSGWGIHLNIPEEMQNSLKMRFALIPPGTFTMGADANEKAVKMREQPQHEVSLSKPYYLCVHEVSLKDFRQFVKDTNYQIDPRRDAAGVSQANLSAGNWVEDPLHPWEKVGFDQDETHPVVNVTWFDAMAFCRWLSEKENRTYRLPYEAEWEFACRAGTETVFNTGNSLWYYGPMENHSDQTVNPGLIVHMQDASPWKDGYANTSPVGTFPQNHFGLFDTHGNVREWCMDWCDEEYYSHSPKVDPRGPQTGSSRVLRGGCWGSNEYYCRSGRRMERAPGSRNVRNGFRILCEISPESEFGPYEHSPTLHRDPRWWYESKIGEEKE
ncbi:Serine/threonine-protein kinase pkn1 [Gimesia alba]|uniref:Serine/threonine-protein kinase pkn1 n=1 Tax=Gimesia alba TaxID=2527973 RepID=A0A517RP60_9PLAN|nr:formylglycine-generating enzyme family protein [Gimesia alba]QDT45671.1 Serine/threonine-protein kinase pkn1 [Gimesia alba]